MKRRDMVKRGAVASALLAIPGMMRAMASTSTDDRVDVPLLLTIHDPNFVPDARILLRPMTDPEQWVAVDIDRLAAERDSPFYPANNEKTPFSISKIRMTLNGQRASGVLDASACGGWVRFIENTLNGNGCPMPVQHPKGLGFVTGIAFGEVRWHVDRELYENTRPEFRPPRLRV